MSIFEAAKLELVEFLNGRFSRQDHFAIVYGSHAYGTATASSDLDLIVFVRERRDEDVRAVVQFVVDLHRRFGMKIDYEIRHELKLVVSAAFLDRILCAEGFSDGAGEYFIPVIEKTQEGLSSERLLLRFFLDSMNHAHVFLSGSEQSYSRARKAAERNLLLALLRAKRLASFTLEELVSHYIAHDGRTGDFYLGFEERPYYRAYLRTMLGSLLGRLEERGDVAASVDAVFQATPRFLASKPVAPDVFADPRGAAAEARDVTGTPP